MYSSPVASIPDSIASIEQGRLHGPGNAEGARLILRGGRVVDPASGLDATRDLVLAGGRVAEVGERVSPVAGDRVVDIEGLVAVPGLIEVHVHLHDLFEVTTAPIFEAVGHGTTLAISPGAGNTLMAPSLLGAEVDRGLPLNVGLLLGAPALLGTAATLEELIAFFLGELDEGTALQKLSRNRIVTRTGHLVVGVKDHMGHFIQSDERLDQTFELADRAGLFFMSHCQDPDHAERLARSARGRRVHLAHVTAAGFGSHGDGVESLQRCIELCRQPNVTGEFLTTALRPGLGNRDGVLMRRDAQAVAYDALREGVVDVLASDGQCDATMKGFGDTRDNVPCLVELVDEGILDISASVATMTANPARLLAEHTGQSWWTEEVGHLGVGARANVTVIDWQDKEATYTVVGGEIAAFEGRVVRRAAGLGGWVTRLGILERTGVGDLALWDRTPDEAGPTGRSA
jgi:dihydroorotase-like cyclic amidohydrolase